MEDFILGLTYRLITCQIRYNQSLGFQTVQVRSEMVNSYNRHYVIVLTGLRVRLRTTSRKLPRGCFVHLIAHTGLSPTHWQHVFSTYCISSLVELSFRVQLSITTRPLKLVADKSRMAGLRPGIFLACAHLVFYQVGMDRSTCFQVSYFCAQSHSQWLFIFTSVVVFFPSLLLFLTNDYYHSDTTEKRRLSLITLAQPMFVP